MSSTFHGSDSSAFQTESRSRRNIFISTVSSCIDLTVENWVQGQRQRCIADPQRNNKSALYISGMDTVEKDMSLEVLLLALSISTVALMIWGMWTIAFGIRNEMRGLNQHVHKSESNMAYQPATFANLPDDEFGLIWYRVEHERRRREAKHREHNNNDGHNARNQGDENAYNMYQTNAATQRPRIMSAQRYIE